MSLITSGSPDGAAKRQSFASSSAARCQRERPCSTARIYVHSQLPPETMSVSLNILRIDPAQAWRDQYGFDLEHGTVSHVLNPTSSEAFLRCAVGLGGEEARDLAEYFGRHHPSDRMRLASFEARAMLADADEADALWREAEKSGNRLVAREAKFRRAEIDTEQRQR